MTLASAVLKRLSELGCPLLAGLHVPSKCADENLVSGFLFEPGDLRNRLLDWCLQKGGQASTSTELWLSATGTCPGEEVVFKEAKMSRTRQIQVWASIVDLLTPLEEVDEFQGIVEQLAEAVSFESQARADNLDIMPIQLAREVKSLKKGEVEEMPSLKAVSSFLKEVQKERSEVEEVQQDCEESEPVNSDGVEESFSRLGQEIAKFNTKYQGELLPWLPSKPFQPKDRPEINKALQVIERTEEFMEASRRLAHTTTRLEQNKSEIDQQTESSASQLPLFTPEPTIQATSTTHNDTAQHLTSPCL